MSASFDIIISGGGMVGRMLAALIAESRLRVALIEREPPRSLPAEGYDLRVSAISIATEVLFARLGLWERIAARASPIRRMRVWDEGGSGAIDFDADEIAEPRIGWIVENAAMVAALDDFLKQRPHVAQFTEASLREASFSRDHVALVIEGAGGRRSEATTRLLVGADGARSEVRHLASLDLNRLPLAQTSIVAFVETEQAHEHTALQRFLRTGPIAFLPMPPPHLRSIVWSLDTARADEMLAMPEAAFSGALADAVEGRVGQTRLISPRAGFPLAASVAPRFTAPRVALIGDAAHTVHPLAGQGVNIGYLDAAALAEEVMGAAQRGIDIGNPWVLKRYERARKGADYATVAMTAAFRYVFSNDWPVVTQLRNAGLSLANRLPPFKRRAIRFACGLGEDVPGLARRAG